LLIGILFFSNEKEILGIVEGMEISFFNFKPLQGTVEKRFRSQLIN